MLHCICFSETHCMRHMQSVCDCMQAIHKEDGTKAKLSSEFDTAATSLLRTWIGLVPGDIGLNAVL